MSENWALLKHSKVLSQQFFVFTLGSICRYLQCSIEMPLTGIIGARVVNLTRPLLYLRLWSSEQVC